MIIIKNKTSDPFARIPNDLLCDPNLKWRDKGLLSYLLGKPVGWKLNIKDLIARSKDGQDAVYSSLNHLIKCGYCQRSEKRNSLGKITGVEYSIADNPYFLTYENPDHEKDEIAEWARSVKFDENGERINPDRENPDTGNPDRENHNHSKKEVSKNKVSKNKEEEHNFSLDYDNQDTAPKRKSPADFPWAQVMAIFKRMRPAKIFRKNPRGVTERHIKAFWRRNGKTASCFELLCEKITSSDYLMGKNGFEDCFPSPDPNWSWVFGKTANGDWRSDKILSGDYSNDKMAFISEKAATEEVYVIGAGIKEINLAEVMKNGDKRFQMVGEDAYTGKKKYADMQKAGGAS